MKKTLIALLLSIVFVPSYAFAQIASSTTASVDVATLIAQLQAQIKELTLQLEAIQVSGDVAVTTSTEFIAVRAFTQTLHRGMFGEEVKELQRFLTQHPEIYPEGIISGYFGALTEGAVRKFQEAQGLEPVGIVGPKTRAVINVSVSGGGGSGVAQDVAQTTATTPVPPPPSPVPTPTPQAVTTPPPPPPPPATSGGGGSSYQIPTGYYHGTQTYVSEPTPPASPPPPPSSPSSTSTASTTPPAPPPTPSPSPSPTPPPPPPASDTTGPTITSLSITPTNTTVGGAVSFSATAEDPSGIQTIIYNIHYPGSSYVLRPNCNYNGVTSGTCGFGESIDHGIQNPSILGDYIINIRIVDLLGNSAYYYSNGSVTGGVSATHSLTIPAVTISAP